MHYICTFYKPKRDASLMKKSWYLGFLVVALTFFGISLDKTTSANQQIILKFTNLAISEGETQEVLSFVKQQLSQVAVGDIQIKKSANGDLKISYYSNVAIADIKELFSEKSALFLANTVPDNESSKSGKEDYEGYELDIFEIQSPKESVGSEGTFVDFKTESVRFYTPNFYSFSETYTEITSNSIVVMYHTYTTIALAIDQGSYAVPQVRAGPLRA